MEQGGRAPAANTARRLFFALWPDEAVRRAIGNLVVDLPKPRGARAIRPERFHVTVVFLGDFDSLSDSMLATIRSAADSVRACCFELSLDHVDGFARAHVGWLGPSNVPAALTDLHDALDVALRSAGVPLKSSTPFVPHITIQRNVRTSVPVMDLAPIEWKVRDFVLITSVPGSPEPYRIVGTWPLVTH